ncbi:MAG TPA: hypothetical protein VJ826_01365, partial [Candidatus Polarisedimenticolaceae bacterium]|nr:hypothetical protein [Candidatus Polarisedimenticolaceae bacterium]
VWGGNNGLVLPGSYFASGGKYDPATDTWQLIASAPASLEARDGHTVVWTGTEMIVWGGYNGTTPPLGSGARYSPSTNSWTATASGPQARREHSAVWTGSSMIVFGGMFLSDGSETASGSRYNPTTNTWLATSLAPIARYGHAAVWTGSKMIVWGGWQGAAEGSIYDPSANSWVTIPVTGAPISRAHPTAVWTGSEMIVWGGNDYAQSPMNTGGRYDPAAGTWTLTSTGSGVPIARTGHSAVWSGSEMIVCGGRNTGCIDPGAWSTCGRYQPSTNSWLSTVNSPTSRNEHTAVWTGSRMIVWGGSSAATDLYCGSCIDGDSDGLCNAADNCPGVVNPGQENTDGDAFGNVCDCSPLDPTNPVPAPVSIVTFTNDPNNATMQWPAVAAATSYEVVRGTIASLPVGPGVADEACFSGLSSPVLVDGSVPASGYFYVVRSRNACGPASYGTDSHDVPRTTGTCP